MCIGNVRYELYDLDENPYADRPLDALASEDDRELLLELEGFLPLGTMISKLKVAIRERRPAFFLITGLERSGRTSLANHVIHLYQHLTGADDGSFPFVVHRVERHEMTHDAYALLRSTLLSLRNKMRSNSIRIPAELYERFNTLSLRGSNDPLDEYDLQAIAQEMTAAFAASGAGFGIRYEGVSTKDLLVHTARVFEDAPTVVVFTIDSYEHGNTVQLTQADRLEFARHGAVIHLSTLTPHQIAMLAEGRWTGRSPSPFDPEGVESAFSTRQYTIGQALRCLAVLLDFRLVEYVQEGQNEPWPTERLRMMTPWLQRMMWQGEQWNRGNGTDG